MAPHPRVKINLEAAIHYIVFEGVSGERRLPYALLIIRQMPLLQSYNTNFSLKHYNKSTYR